MKNELRIVRSIGVMQALSRKLAKKYKIGLVPTMGFLHEGHLSLIRKAKKLSDKVIVTIFVNPTQFAPHEDLARYPRDEKGDIEKIKEAGGDIVFIPKREDVYPNEFETYVNAEEMTKALEGKYRPGHFRGVTTIVAKLFNIIRPDIAVFGMKDYQQAMVLKKMVADLNYPIKMVIMPTVREKDGLALSSRNKYFDFMQKKEAVCLFRALMTARMMVKFDKITDTARLRAAMKRVIKRVCTTAEVDYIAFTDFETLKPVGRVNKDTVCSLAVKLHGVRLIDNLQMK